MKDKKNIVTSVLSKMKAEQEKRSVIYQHGVDLSNYENGFYESAMELLVCMFDGNSEVVREYIEWWLFEGGEEVFVGGGKISVKNADKFVGFLTDLERTAPDQV